MGFRRDTRSYITRVFPGRDSLIERAHRESSSFRDLCRDYRKCAAVLASWRESENGASSPRAREYDELLGELAQELEAWLDVLAGGSKTPSDGGSE